MAAACNEGDLYRKDGAWGWRGDPTDIALLALAGKGGVHREALLARRPAVNGIPFEPEHRFACSLHADDGQTWVAVKGAPERVIEMCRPAPDRYEAVHAAAADMANRGQRVLALASGRISRVMTPEETPAEPRDLEFVGLVGLIDPLRPGVSAAVRRCDDAGIRVIMVTGDHPVTALAIAREIGIATRDTEVVHGSELRAGDDGLIVSSIRTGRVYARVTPDQKLSIVKAAQKAGHFVAVTGDGVNDAPALRHANIGVAMGRGGTDVARDASDVVLSDDNFATIVAGVEEGRIAYQNIRNVVYLVIAAGIAEVLTVGLAVIIGLPLPLLPVQLLWLNLVTNGFQDMALAAEKGRGDELESPPRSPGERVFNRLMIERILLGGLWMGLLRVCRVRADAVGGRSRARCPQRADAADGADAERRYLQRAIRDGLGLPDPAQPQPVAGARRGRGADLARCGDVHPADAAGAQHWSGQRQGMAGSRRDCAQPAGRHGGAEGRLAVASTQASPAAGSLIGRGPGQGIQISSRLPILRPMSDRLLYLDPDSRLSLQAQIRHRLVEAIHLGVFKPGARLPSSRKLAEQLGVARNTVVLACQQLAAEGLLTGRPRSGLYVAQRVAWPALGVGDSSERAGITGRWQQWLKARANPDTARSAPADARSYPYCFLEGQFDASLFPVSEWREACRYALGSSDIEAWSAAGAGLDDPLLVEELRSKILPMRGINARADEILITVGAQQALYLLAELLIDSSVSVAIEEPGYPAMRHLRQSSRRTGRSPADRRRRPAGRQHARRLPHRLRHAQPPGRDGRDHVAGPPTRLCWRRQRSATCWSSRTTSTAKATTRVTLTRHCAAWTARIA